MPGREATMESLLPHHSPFLTLAQAQDLIGFDNLLVGCLPKLLIRTMEPMLASLINRKFTIHRWAQELSRQLLLFTHRQWSYRNSTAHYKPSEGKTVAEHELVDDQVKSLLLLPLSSLPPQHRHLLAQDQTKSLLRGTTTAKQFWIANVHSALADKIQERYSTYKVSQQDQTGTYCSLGLTASSYCKHDD